MDMRRTLASRADRHKRALPSSPAREGAQAGVNHRERLACPLYTAIGVIEGRWKPMLFQHLSLRPHGFGQLRRLMPDVSAKVLREQLREMEADGLVVKRPLTPAHLGVRYSVTRYGRTLGPVFELLWRWGTSHLARRGARLGTRVTPPRIAASPDERRDGETLSGRAS
jgi:DNA-binding HxlR family transcriptional regulator